MTPATKIVIGLLAIGIFLMAWMFRYETVQSGPYMVHVKDRWFGGVERCNLVGCHRIY